MRHAHECAVFNKGEYVKSSLACNNLLVVNERAQSLIQINPMQM